MIESHDDAMAALNEIEQTADRAGELIKKMRKIIETQDEEITELRRQLAAK